MRNVYFYPAEFNTYAGSGANLTYRADINGSWRKEYKIFDHLGDIRSVVNDMGVTEGKFDYEPFGKKMVVLDNQNRLTFIGKENDFESQFGDFGVRKYDDETGRFISVDAMWEKNHFESPYVYSSNNPLRFVDRGGLTKEYAEYLLMVLNDKLNKLYEWQSKNNVEYGGLIISQGFVISIPKVKAGYHFPNGVFIDDAEINPGEVKKGRAHTHPEGEAHSATDIIKMAEPNANENIFPYLLPGNYSIIEAGSTRFVLEVVDRKQANAISNKIEGVYKKAFQEAKKQGKSHAEATVAAAKAVCNLPNSGLKLYQTTNLGKKVLKQIAGKR